MTPVHDDARLRGAVMDRAASAAGRGDFAQRRSRARGCLVGGAIGDALGAPIEFLSRDEIVARFGPAGLQDFAPAYGMVGAVTDDTQMTLFTAEGLLRGYVRWSIRGIGPVFAAVTDRAYGRWLLTQGDAPTRASVDADGWLITHRALFARRAPGATCIGALRTKGSSGGPAVNDSKGCGGVMRSAPVGVFAASLDTSPVADDRATFKLGHEIAALTHGHPTGQIPAAYLSVLVAALVGGSAWRDAIARAWTALQDAEAHAETSAAVTAALAAAERQPRAWKALTALGGGWVAEEALAIGIYCAAGVARAEGTTREAVREALLLSVNHDGDSDSTGSITGNIVGAMVGYDALPAAWRESVELAPVIAAMADDLVTFPSWGVDDHGETEENRYWSHRYPGH